MDAKRGCAPDEGRGRGPAQGTTSPPVGSVTPPAGSLLVGSLPAGRLPVRLPGALLLGALLLAMALAGCGALGSVGEPALDATTSTEPPPGASQAPGPPLATATAPPAGAVNRSDPAAVAADCFIRWQSFDARTDSGPTAGRERARACFTEDFAASLGLGGSAGTASGGTGDDDGQAWQELRAAGTRSTAEVLATTPLGGIDTTSTGRIVLQLNVRRESVSGTAAPVTAVSTPALTLLRQPNGTWQIAGADLASVAGDAPGR